jgi:membrane-bound lytic murein transglycosylase A
MSRRPLALALGALAGLALLAGLVWSLRGLVGGPEPVPLPRFPGAAPPPAGRLILRPARFADLPGWVEDAHAAAVPALLRSCRRIAGLPDGAELGGIAGTAGEWRQACAAAAALPTGDDLAARAFFETSFEPLAAADGAEPSGLFTGYYEPALRGSRRRHGRYRIPLYLRPPELLTIDLGRFREEFEGKKITGRIEGREFVPFPDRRAIDAGALAGRRLELVWVDDPIAAFFLHIQGSGRVELAEGGVLRVGYAAQNGHPYRAIGRDLVARGALTREEVSLQSIRRWLLEHPREAPEVMAANASYVFFHKLPGGAEGPLGAQGVALTPGRSLAVDRNHLPLGAPVWLAGTAPAPREGDPDRPLRRLLVAQDTGGAIEGPVRGDVFWGYGEEAEAVAGRMKHQGRIWLLLPHGPAHREPRPRI